VQPTPETVDRGGDEEMAGSDRYVVISADCHGGADLLEYRDYLDARHHDRFDAWLGSTPSCTRTSSENSHRELGQRATPRRS